MTRLFRCGRQPKRTRGEPLRLSARQPVAGDPLESTTPRLDRRGVFTVLAPHLDDHLERRPEAVQPAGDAVVVVDAVVAPEVGGEPGEGPRKRLQHLDL